MTREIRFEHVSHAFGDRRVLTDVHLTLTEPRVGIVGANGSGKSTLARLINGLVEPSSGTVSVDGLSVARDGKRVRERVGFVFTDPDTQIVMPTVREDVAFTLRRTTLSRAEAAARVTAILERFGLADHADHPAHLLSGGQKQLLALASVLVAEPAVLIADEPTTLLDARNAAMIAATFGRLDQRVVVVTHQLDLVADFDRVLVIDDGRVVADDLPGPALAAYRRVLLA
ncbi:energy-coupling factor ABC transporter ATP-binding protein [Nakamurella deserti]|uniref:energy-coupling factor ABC transporter ATP-binding protein n=1 Tax=Nakamurella deserti TaxID=2164074 RepID=UPI000DBEA770|nr:ABC transporter ATP-binding protein [Nakamurella deserti]